jgi:hypothetical protein
MNLAIEQFLNLVRSVDAMQQSFFSVYLDASRAMGLFS